MQQVQLGFAGLSVPIGCHIGYSYENELDRQSLLLSYIAMGLRENEKCITVVTEYPADFWTNRLPGYGISRNAVNDGQLTILTHSQLFRGGRWKPDGVFMDLVAESVESALDEGWKRVRVCTGFNHLFHGRRHLDHLLDAEYLVDRHMDGKPVTMLCTFDANHLHSSLIDTLLALHPLLTDGSSIRENDGFCGFDAPACDTPERLRGLAATGALVPPFARIDFHEDTPVVRIGDEMDAYTSPMVENIASWLQVMGHKCLVADLSDTVFVDAASVSALYRIMSALIRSGGRFVIYDRLEQSRKIFHLIKLNEQIPVYIDLDEAERAVRQPCSSPRV